MKFLSKSILPTLLIPLILNADNFEQKIKQKLFYKEPIVKELKHWLLNEKQFKNSYDQYLSFYNGQQDPHIQQALKLIFEGAMQNEISELASMKKQLVDLRKNKAVDNNNKFFINIDSGKIIFGITKCVGALAVGSISIWGLKEALKPPVYLTDGDAMIPFLFFGAIGMGIAGIDEIIKGFNHSKILQNETSRKIQTIQNRIKNISRNIEILDAHYAYVYQNKEKLSTQVAKN